MTGEDRGDEGCYGRHVVCFLFVCFFFLVKGIGGVGVGVGVADVKLGKILQAALGGLESGKVHRLKVGSANDAHGVNGQTEWSKSGDRQSTTFAL